MSQFAAPIKLGMITVEPHGRPWAEVLTRMPNVKMECAWDYDTGRARSYADKYGIPHVAENVEDMLGMVDAVLVGGGRRMPTAGEVWGEAPDDHLRLSRPFLEAGYPVLVDKPLADRMEDAIEMVRLSRRCGALLMSCSAARFAPEVVALKAAIEDGGLGSVSGATCVIGTGLTTLSWYIIHILEAMAVPFGADLESTVALPATSPVVIGPKGMPRAYGVVFRWRDGKLATVFLASDETDAAEAKEQAGRPPRILWPTATVVPPYLPMYYNIRVFGDMNWAEVRIVGKGYYRRKLDAFLEMIRTREEAIPLEETLQLTQAIILAEKSLTSGKVEKLVPVQQLMAA